MSTTLTPLPDTPAARAATSAAPPMEPFIAATTHLQEFTWRAVIVGTILGIVFGASSLYLVLKVGLTVSASIPVAVDFDQEGKCPPGYGRESVSGFRSQLLEENRKTWVIPQRIPHWIEQKVAVGRLIQQDDSRWFIDEFGER